MTVIDEILDQENHLSHAKRMLDVDAIDRIYADDLLMTGVLGEPTCSKSAIMDEMRRGIAERDAAKAEGTQFDTRVENEDTRVVPLGETAVATYRFVVTFEGPGRNVRRRYRTTNVWAKRGGRWQIVAAHTAFVLAPQQAAMLDGSGSAQ
jgi:ketosteroid isomerase-like protein